MKVGIKIDLSRFVKKTNIEIRFTEIEKKI